MPQIAHLVLHLLLLLCFKQKHMAGIFTSYVYLCYTKRICVALGGEPRSCFPRQACCLYRQWMWEGGKVLVCPSTPTAAKGMAAPALLSSCLEVEVKVEETLASGN